MFPQHNSQFVPQSQFYQPWGQSLPRQEIIRVNGENGARAYQMAPNSTALLLDESAPLVWLIQTDGAGYKTATPYTITPYQAQTEPDYRTLKEEIGKLDEKIRGLEEVLNGQKSYAGNAKRSKPGVIDAGE